MILDAIVENKKMEVAALKETKPMNRLEELIGNVEAPRDFRGALRRQGISLIAEIKRSSPSKGDMLPQVDALELGLVYQENGARALSVLTDQKFFKGTLADLSKAHQGVQIPCLRKEFIIDPYQIYEARSGEADAVLFIVRILTDKELSEFIRIAASLKMAALVETHTEDEVKRALDCGAHIIGINNRDLDTLEINLNTTMELKKHVPGGHILVSESGIYTHEQVKRLEDGGVDAILVGESLLTHPNVGGKVRELLGH